MLLASASPACRRLLELAAIPQRVQVSGVDQEAITDPSPAQFVQKLAQAKAAAVAERLPSQEKRWLCKGRCPPDEQFRTEGA